MKTFFLCSFRCKWAARSNSKFKYAKEAHKCPFNCLLITNIAFKMKWLNGLQTAKWKEAKEIANCGGKIGFWDADKMKFFLANTSITISIFVELYIWLSSFFSFVICILFVAIISWMYILWCEKWVFKCAIWNVSS